MIEDIDDELVLEEALSRYGLEDKLQLVLSTLFPEQRAFIAAPSRHKAAKCGRRAGKTRACGAYAYKAALEQPGLMVPYIALTKGHARRLLWPVLREIDRVFELGLVFNETELLARLPNGSQIWLTGADKPVEMEKLRGGAYPLVVIDEAASFGPRLEYLVEDVLDPALEDYNGSLALMGSPAAACTGMFYEVTTGLRKGWATHAWTVLDNEKFPRWRGAPNWRDIARLWLETKKADKGWGDDHPVYRREWLGQWVRDVHSLVYRYDETRNGYDGRLPDGHAWEHILGIDLGFDDQTVFAVMAFCRDLPMVFEVESYAQTAMIPDAIAAKVRELQAHYNIRAIKVDTGGLGKMITHELMVRHSLPLTPAEKVHKYDFIELLNGDLQAGRLKVLRGGALANEWAVLQWDEDRRKEDPRFLNDRSDAALYAWRECKHYTFRPKPSMPETGTEAFWQAEAKRMERELADRVRRRVESDELSYDRLLSE